MALTKPVPQDDFRARLDRAIQKAGLTDDLYGDLFVLLREWHDEIKAGAPAYMPQPSRIEQVITKAAKRAIGVLAWRKIAVVFVAGVVLGGVCFGVAGYQIRDAQIARNCMMLYQSDVCAAIWRSR